MQLSPPRQSYRDLPVMPVSYWETVTVVRQALDDLERGQFRRAALLADAMLRDDRILGVLSTRLNGLLSRPLTFEPPAEENAAFAEGIQAQWPRMVAEADLEDLFRWGVMLGIGVGELIWDTKDDVWVPRLKVWHPSNLYWRWDTRTYWLNTMDGPVEIPDYRQGGASGKWVLFTPYGYERAWNRCAMRALAIPWLVRGFARRDWAHFSEQHGSGIKKGIVPANVPTEERERFVKGLNSIGNAATLECPMLPDGTRFDLEFVEAKADTWEGFQALLGHAETAIAIVVLGQNLTTEVSTGSRAAAQVHDAVRMDYQRADNSKLGGALRDQLLKPVALYNAGNAEIAPTPQWDVEPPEDLDKLATALQALGTFVTSMLTAGVTVNVRALLTQFGVEMLAEGEKQEFAPPKADPDPADEPDPNDPSEEDEPDEEPLKHKAPVSDTVPPGARRGQEYVDRLVAVAVERAAQTLDVDLLELRTIVEESVSPSDLRQRLVRAYRGMDVTQLALLVDRAQVLAQLAGQKSVLEDA